METLKICYLARNYGSVIHGPSLYGTCIVDGAVKKGHEVWLVTPDKTKNNEKIRFVYVKKPRDLKHATWIELSKTFSKKIGEIEEKFDAVHFLNSLEIMRYNNNLNNVYTTIHGYHFAESTWNLDYYLRMYPYDWYFRYLYYNIGRMMEKKNLKKMKHIFAVSEYMKNSLMKNYGIGEEKISVVPNGIEIRKEKFTRKFNHNILLVGNNFQTKGVSTLILATKILKNEFPEMKVTIVGEDKATNYMKKIAREEGVQEMVNFTGHVNYEQLKEYYKKADIFAMPSTIESFGIALLEAMNYGLPLIGTNAGGIPEIIEEGKNGFLIEPKKPKALAEKNKNAFHRRQNKKKYGTELSESSKKIRHKKHSGRNTEKILKTPHISKEAKQNNLNANHKKQDHKNYQTKMACNSSGQMKINKPQTQKKTKKQERKTN
ncbi:MAG: glycosyltransferase family 4 protein [archaeon]